MLVSYAQNLEDILLHRVLRSVTGGFYIDVGAYDPLIDSVTKLFYEQGWSGINIEASPARHKKMVEDRPRDINLNLAVSDRSGNVLFHQIGDSGLSTTVDEYAERHVSLGFDKLSYAVPCETLTAICDSHVKGPIHFLKIDIEGAEEAAIRGADLQRYRPWIILVEATEPLTDIPSHQGWEPIILRSAYEFVAFDGLNRFYLAAEHAELKPLFMAPADDYRRATDIWTPAHLRAENDRLRRDILATTGQLREFQQPGGNLDRRISAIAAERDRWFEAAVAEVPLRWRKPQIGAAREAASAGNWELAARLYRQVLQVRGSTPGIWVQYGHALREAGRPHAAEAAYRQAAALPGAGPDVHLQLGHALVLQRRAEEAAECYLRALKLGSPNGAVRDLFRAVGWSAEDIAAAMSDRVSARQLERLVDYLLTIGGSAGANSYLVDRFTAVFQENMWGDAESVSGAGSRRDSPAAAAAVAALRLVHEKVGFRSINDIPCGDFRWIEPYLQSTPDLVYRGFDIVEPLIEKNKKLHPGFRFFTLDVTSQAPPRADLIFSKDLFNHLADEDIWSALRNMKRSQSAYLLASNNFGAENEPLPADFGPCSRLLDLCSPPFSIASPVWSANYMGLWKLADIRIA